MEIKEQIIVLVKSKKSKTINIKEIREKHTPQNEKILKNEIEKLVQERYIEPQKTSKTNVEGISEKYKIIKQDDANIKQEIINLSKLMVNNTNDVASVVLEIQYLSFQVEYKNNDVYSIRRSVYVGIPVSFDLYLNISNSLYDANGNLTDINWQNN